MDTTASRAIKEEEVRKLAEIISKWKDSYDQFVWLLAEAELRIQLQSQPSPEQIKPLAEYIYHQHHSLQDLHWFLAEKYLQLLKPQ
jgi:hypothetical protein